MPFLNIDSHGKKRDRQAVKAIMKMDERVPRLAAAEVKRQRKALKRSGGELVLLPVPSGGVKPDTPNGSYVWRGDPEVKYAVQVIVVGFPMFSPEQYREVAERWCGSLLEIDELKAMDPPDDPERAALVKARGFLSIILAEIV
jgi:hypothetical protein